MSAKLVPAERNRCVITGFLTFENLLLASSFDIDLSIFKLREACFTWFDEFLSIFGLWDVFEFSER
jgi:hypothetical protein